MFVSCNKDCGAGCPLEAVIDNGTIISIRDNPHRGKYMRGCAKGYRMHTLLSHPDRLLYPVARTGPRGSSKFERISWEEALDTVAGHLAGRDAGTVLRLGGSGACEGKVHNTITLTKRFLSGLGAYCDTKGGYSSETTDYMKDHLTGTRNVGIDVRTLLDTKFLVLLGFNPRDTRFGCETEEVLKEIRRKNIPAVLIDPRRTASADLCGASWIPIRPGTDAVLLTALLHEAVSSGYTDISAVESYAKGFSEIARWTLGEADGMVRDPLWAQDICGIDARRICELAEMLMTHHPAALIPGLSVQRTIGGEEADRMGLALQAALGNIGVSGGSAGCGQWNYGPGISVSGISQSIEGAPDCGHIPVSIWPDGVDEQTMVYNVGGNYLGQGNNIRRSAEALERAACTVTHEQFLTPTARFSDIVLPVTMFLERRDLRTSNSELLLYSEAAAEPPGEVRDDYWIFSQLAGRLGYEEAFTMGRSADGWFDHILESLPAEAKEACINRGFWESPQRPWTGLSDYIKNPAAHPLPTPSGRIELNPESYQKASGSRFPILKLPEVSAEFPLALITPHGRFHIHSQYSGVKKPLNRLLVMHPLDARNWNISEGQSVRVQSAHGELIASVHIHDSVAQGVVSKLQGSWPVFDDETGELLENDSVNMVTSPEPSMPSLGSRTHSTAVEVEGISRR